MLSHNRLVGGSSPSWPIITRPPCRAPARGPCNYVGHERTRTGRRHRTAPAGAFRRPTGAKRRLLGRRCARTNSPVDCWLARGRPPSPAFLIPKPFSGLGIFCVADKTDLFFRLMKHRPPKIKQHQPSRLRDSWCCFLGTTPAAPERHRKKSPCCSFQWR